MLGNPRPGDGIIMQELGSELCLMRLDTQDVLVLNQTASDIWLLVDGTIGSSRMIELLATSYQVSEEEIEPQVAAILEEFESRGFVVPQHGSP